MGRFDQCCKECCELGSECNGKIGIGEQLQYLFIDWGGKIWSFEDFSKHGNEPRWERQRSLKHFHKVRWKSRKK